MAKKMTGIRFIFHEIVGFEKSQAVIYQRKIQFSSPDCPPIVNPVGLDVDSAVVDANSARGRLITAKLLSRGMFTYEN